MISGATIKREPASQSRKEIVAMNDSIETAFTGRVGKDIELRTSKTGKPWCSFTVAVGADNDTQWVRVALFGEKAEEAARAIAKGDRVYIEGRLKLATWEKDGQTRHGLDVAAWLAQPMGKIGNRKPKRANPGEGQATPPDGSRDWQRPIETGQGNGVLAAVTSDDPIPF